MNIYIQELKLGTKSFVYWTLGLVFTMLTFLLFFPTVAKDASLMQQIFDQFPPEFARAFGFSGYDLSDILGYYGFLFTYIMLVGAIYAMKSGISILSEEIRIKAADFLLVKPISRTSIVTAKLLSVVTFIVSQNILYIITTIISIKAISSEAFDYGNFILINLSLFFVEMFFVAFGLFLSVCIKRIKSVLPITLGVVFGFYVLQLLSQSLSNVNLAYFTPFAYFDIAEIIKGSGYKLVFLALDIILIFVFILLTYIIYNKEDIPSV